MFKQLYYKILCQSLQNIDERFKKIIIYKLGNKDFFNSFISKNISNSDFQFRDQLLQFYQQDKEGAIRSALSWKSFAGIKNEWILLSYQLQPAKQDTENLVFYKYNVKDQIIDREIYSIYGKTWYMFQNMDKKNQPLIKIYNTMKKYAFRIL